MTPELMATLRPVVAWARRNGWGHDVYTWQYRSADYRLIVHDDGDGWIAVDGYSEYRYTRHVGRFWASSPQQAVDVLCALGVLPVELSPAHRAGRLAGFRYGFDVGWLAYQEPA